MRTTKQNGARWRLRSEKAQAQAVVPPVSEQIEHTQKFSSVRTNGWADEYVQWKVECDKELLEAEERLARMRVEVETPTAPVPDPATEVRRPQHQLAQAQVQLLQHGCTLVTAGSTAKRPRRREDFVCSCTEEVIEWMSDRQMDIQQETARGNGQRWQVVEFGGPSSDEFALPPIRPSAREFIWSRKRDGSVIGRSARSAAKYGHRGSRVGEATPPKNQLLDRLQKFANGEWIDLLGLSREASESAASIRSRRSRTRVDTVEKRVERAEALISMGEISAARHALEGSPGQRGHSERIEG